MSAAKPSRREVALAEKLRDAADDLTKATNYAETYMARVAIRNAIRDLQAWAIAGRPIREKVS